MKGDNKTIFLFSLWNSLWKKWFLNCSHSLYIDSSQLLTLTLGVLVMQNFRSGQTNSCDLLLMSEATQKWVRGLNLQKDFATILNVYIMLIFAKSLFVFLGVFVPLENFLLLWSCHHYRWRAANFDLCSAIMAIEQWGFFSVPHLL